jgi:hypothetical protein
MIKGRCFLLKVKGGKMNNHSSPPVRFSVEINGQVWQQVESLETSGPNDRHYTLKLEGENQAVLTFGDGKHGARPPSGAGKIKVAYDKGASFVNLILSQDDQEPDEDLPRYYSLYRGVVTQNLDPEQMLRIQVQVPEVLGLTPAWAQACVPFGAAVVPPLGKHVWVMFEHGDPRYPVWIGTLKTEN